VFERGRDVYEEEGAVFLNGVLGGLSGLLEGSDGSGNGGGTGFGEFGGDESNACNVLVAVFSRESELGGKF
jgi:hypothetical protein